MGTPRDPARGAIWDKTLQVSAQSGAEECEVQGQEGPGRWEGPLGRKPVLPAAQSCLAQGGGLEVGADRIEAQARVSSAVLTLF